MYLYLWLSISLFWPPVFVFGAVSYRNITVDDSNTTAIVYYPVACPPSDSWIITVNETAFLNGTERFCNIHGATATLVFEGVAVYFLSAIWDTQMTLTASLDGGDPQLVNITDPDVPSVFNGVTMYDSTPVWSAVGLDNVEHTLVIGNGNSQDGYFDLNIDGFIYTVEEDDNNTSTSSSSSSSPTSSATSITPTSTSTSQSQSQTPITNPNPADDSSSHSRSRTKTTGIALGVSLGVLTLLVAGGLLLLWHRQRMRSGVVDISNRSRDNRVRVDVPALRQGWEIEPFAPMSEASASALASMSAMAGRGAPSQSGLMRTRDGKGSATTVSMVGGAESQREEGTVGRYESDGGAVTTGGGRHLPFERPMSAQTEPPPYDTLAMNR